MLPVFLILSIHVHGSTLAEPILLVVEPARPIGGKRSIAARCTMRLVRPWQKPLLRVRCSAHANGFDFKQTTARPMSLALSVLFLTRVPPGRAGGNPSWRKSPETSQLTLVLVVHGVV